ncbi:MAG: hypothetical protein IKG77_09935 [Prevotella sp.]|nr:hypothetical protein [Prevotella sp.]
MKKNETLEKIFQLATEARLGEAIDALENHLLGRWGSGVPCVSKTWSR